MKKIRIIFCIIIAIICIQLTSARFITKQPKGIVEGSIGQAVINLEGKNIEYTGYNNDYSLPCLFDATDIITYYFNVNNYDSNNIVSDVDLGYSVYVVFYDETGIVQPDIDCELTEENEDEHIEKEFLTQTRTLNLNGIEKILPEGTIKFTPSNILQAKTKSTHSLKLEIKANIDSLPTSQIFSNMKVYCLAEQNI